MSWLTLSRTIPTAIFTILASYALWESHAPHKKRQRLRQTVAFIFFVFRSPPDYRALISFNDQLPGNICTWRLPGDNYKLEEQIWINLDKVFRDAGLTLWPHAFYSTLRIRDYPSSGGFGYVLPTRGKKGAGGLAKLLDFNYNVCSFICLFYPCLTSIDRIHSRELHVPGMDLMLSFASSSLETNGMSI